MKQRRCTFAHRHPKRLDVVRRGASIYSLALASCGGGTSDVSSTGSATRSAMSRTRVAMVALSRRFLPSLSAPSHQSPTRSDEDTSEDAPSEGTEPLEEAPQLALALDPPRLLEPARPPLRAEREQGQGGLCARRLAPLRTEHVHLDQALVRVEERRLVDRLELRRPSARPVA